MKIRKIERLQSSMSHWKTKFHQNLKECANRNALLTEEKNKIQGHFQQLKLRMNKFREREGGRLSNLTKNANTVRIPDSLRGVYHLVDEDFVLQCTGHLKENIGLAERILKLAELARKLETEREKVAPYYGSSVAAEEATSAAPEQAEDDDKQMEDPGAPQPYQSAAVDIMGHDIAKWAHMDNFWKKYNKVLLDKLAIERERERLRAENASIQVSGPQSCGSDIAKPVLMKFCAPNRNF